MLRRARRHGEKEGKEMLRRPLIEFSIGLIKARVRKQRMPTREEEHWNGIKRWDVSMI